MTRKEAKDLLPIIKAFSEGKEIEGLYKGTKLPWFKIKDMDFNQGIIFRIKPEPKYRPFKNAEECWQEMQKHQPFGWVRDKSWGIYDMIVRVTDSGILFNSSALKDITAYDCPFEKTSFADGTPFGILEEE
mgnify:CR=1 FL=1